MRWVARFLPMPPRETRGKAAAALVYCDLGHDTVAWAGRDRPNCWWCGSTPKQRAAWRQRVASNP